MKIAFASCFCTKVFKKQPVWNWVQAQNPDYLLLLGDSIYLDINSSEHPMHMSDDGFAKHLHLLYSELISNTQFNGLIQSMPNNSVFSIWDDHDFLWNDMLGTEAASSPIHRGKLPITSSFHGVFREALRQSLSVGSFPAKYNDAAFWQPNAMPLATPTVSLPQNVLLHLTDGRTYRTRKWGLQEADRTILGSAQKARIKQSYTQSNISSIHLLASGSTVADYRKSYVPDWEWMSDIASMRRTLVLSGDIHRNEVDAFHNPTFPIHEATSSGAAVRDAVVIGQKRQNFGVLEIKDTQISISLYSDNQIESAKQRVIGRANWLPF
jgi:alkaline phosphatase D